MFRHKLCCLCTPFNAGENCIPDGSGSGSATVGQLEIFILTHQPEFCSIHVTKQLYQSVHLYFKALKLFLLV